MDKAVRLPHAALDGAGRVPKAEKILRLLNLSVSEDRRIKVLEVGTGSGMIAHHFGCRLGQAGEVVAVDVVDQRVVHSDYGFHLVEGTSLPFADGSFDAVISNHVIEHVGGHDDQIAHLRELVRVMRADAKGYLAVPSRWQIVEPHYHLAFLSWLPRGIRSAYLRMRGRGEFYDCEPLRLAEIEALFRVCRLRYRNVFAPALRVLVEAEREASPAARLAAALPQSLLNALRAFSPTHLFLFAKSAEALSNE